MNDTQHPIITFSPRHALIRPEPAQPIRIRQATMDDYPFIDALQKQHSKMVGFLHRSSMEAYIKSGDVLVAEGGCEPWAVGCGQEQEAQSPERKAHSAACHGQEQEAQSPEPKAHSAAEPLGYIVGRDRYFKREDVGIIYQLVVSPGSQRGLIGAALVQQMFENAAYGCKLFCCWCAQDLPANHFWEACGFVPIAFRAGSERKGRMHIFWQKRIRSGDVGPASGGTPWWFPSQTTGGAIREGRLVLPIPPGTHWSDAKPTILPEIPGVDRMIEAPGSASEGEGDDGDAGDLTYSPAHSLKRGGDAAAARRRRTKSSAASRAKGRKKMKSKPQSIVATGGFRFGIAAVPAEAAAQEEDDDAKRKRSRSRTPRPRRMYHPEYVAAARELCARYLEEVQHRPELVDQSTDGGKYDVSRVLAPGNAAPSSFAAARQLTADIAANAEDARAVERHVVDDADGDTDVKLLDAA